MIVPTIGRVVWFHEAFVPDTTEQPRAAIVCHVHNDRLVNLAVFEPHGGVGARESVVLRQEGDEAPSGPFCEWMPYQIGQAKASGGSPGGNYGSGGGGGTGLQPNTPPTT